MTATPEALGDGGSRLWESIDEAHDLDAMQLVQLEEACRAKDRLDRLDSLLRGDLGTWLSVKDFEDGRPSELVINQALAQANATANLMKQLLAALRLPDSVGKRPQVRAARGSYQSGGSGAKVSSIERARVRQQA